MLQFHQQNEQNGEGQKGGYKDIGGRRRISKIQIKQRIHGKKLCPQSSVSGLKDGLEHLTKSVEKHKINLGTCNTNYCIKKYMEKMEWT